MDQFYRVIVRVPKQDSVFLYFTFEANEGICFYSTLDYETGMAHRDIEIMGAPELYAQLKNVLEYLRSEITIEILKDEYEQL